MIKVVIFDMDGLLIDSEPLWREAEKEIFREVGIDMTDEMCNEIMGLRIDEVVAFWHRRFPWNNIPPGEVAARIVDGVIRLVGEKGGPMPGVGQILDFFEHRKIPMALATSSMQRLVDAVLLKLEIKNHFETVQSAETLPYGKPHPEIFLKTAARLGVGPEHCLVFEDSLNGLIAAKAARMRAVCVPDPGQSGDPRFSIADLQLGSLEMFREHHWNELCIA